MGELDPPNPRSQIARCVTQISGAGEAHIR